MEHVMPFHRASRVVTFVVSLSVVVGAVLAPAPAHGQFTQLFVSATSSPSIATVGTPVTFFAQVSGGPIGATYQYFWSFGDGRTGTGQTTTNVYTTPGTFTATVNVASSTGQTGVGTTTVTVSGTGQPGITQGGVSAGGPYTGLPGQAIIFTGSAPFGTFGTQFLWNFGDGTQGTGQTVSKVYTNPGTYTVTLTVYGTTGVIGSATTIASVGTTGTGTTGGVSAGGPYTGQPGQPIVFTGSAPFGTFGTQFLWNFGDGTQGTGQTVSHTYATAGNYTVTLTVSGTTGIIGTATTTASVGTTGTGTTGLVNAGGPYTGAPGQAISFFGSAPGLPNVQQYLWTFGDGTTATGPSVTHAYANPGSYTATLTVTTTTGQTYSASAPVTISGTPTTTVSTATTTVTLVAGCNNIASTWPNGTPPSTIVAAVSPSSAVTGLWRWDAALNRYLGFSVMGAAVSDLTVVNRLESIFICMNTAGTLTRPAF